MSARKPGVKGTKVIFSVIIIYQALYSIVPLIIRTERNNIHVDESREKGQCLPTTCFVKSR